MQHVCCGAEENKRILFPRPLPSFWRSADLLDRCFTMYRIICLAASLLGCAAAAPRATSTSAQAPGSTHGPTATIASGVVQGTASTFPSATVVNKFLGIPFAKVCRLQSTSTNYI
jgi:hypothetical protein